MPRISAANLDEHRQAIRQAVFAAVEDLFARCGYVETTLGDIADHAGIGRTTLYDYFSNKDDLLACLVEDRLPEVFDAMVEAIPRSLSYREQLGALTVSMVEFVVAEPVLGLILHREVPRLSPEAQDRIRASHQGVISEFARIYHDGVDVGEFRALPFDLAGHLILDVVMSAARTLLASNEPKQRFHEIADEAVAFLQGGLTLFPSPSGTSAERSEAMGVPPSSGEVPEPSEGDEPFFPSPSGRSTRTK